MEQGESEPFLAGRSPAMSSPRNSKPGGKPARDAAMESQDTSRDSQSGVVESWQSHAPESQDYEEVESITWRKYQIARYFGDKGHYWTSDRRRTALKWIVTIVIGIVVALVGIAVQYSTEWLLILKFDRVLKQVEEGNWFAALVLFAALNFMFTTVAHICVLIEPLAAGSGIPEVKSYLNGVNLNKVVRVRTLLAKACGVIFSVAGGLPAGKEGPMVHCGSVIAAGISQGKSVTWGVDTSWSRFQDFRNDRAKRDFVSCGAAAGVCAAFRAPIGGVLFSLEEGSSFWSTDLTWRSFFCAMMTLLTIYVVGSAQKSLGQVDATSMFSFGEFYTLTDGNGNFSVWELFLFMGIGCIGGMLGSLCVQLNSIIVVRRKAFAKSKLLRYLEVSAFAIAMALIAFATATMWGSCTSKPTNIQDWTAQEQRLIDELVRFNCKEDEYNQVASLFFAPPDIAIQQLFHFKEDASTNYPTFSTGALLLFLIPYAVMACFTFGVGAPTGVFVPSLLSGAAFGRLCGHLLHELSPATFADSGTYALVGAAAVLGGVSRMTISLTVILLEATGDMQYVLPLMLTLLAARYAGNALSKGLYDMTIELRNIPFLEANLGGHYGILRYTPISDLMAKPVKVFRRVEKVAAVNNTLMNCPHHGFPVVDNDGRIVGLVARKVLTSLLRHRAYAVQEQQSISSSDQPPVSHDTIERVYPRYPHITNIKISPEDANMLLDLRAYMDTAPYFVHESASVQRCYKLFRTLGLRHLVVVDEEHHVKGIITRKDLTERRLESHMFSYGVDIKRHLYMEPLAVDDDGEVWGADDARRTDSTHLHHL